MAINKKKTAKKREIMNEIKQYPSLEELLWAMNGMEKCKVFVKPEFDDEGHIKKVFTKKGSELYERLTALVYGMFNLVTEGEITVNDPERIGAEDIVETLDNIVRNET